MDRQQREAYFEKLMKKDPYGYMDIWYQGRRQKLPVFQIDLAYVIYNQYNGRIASYVKSYEKERGKELDPTNPDDIKTIEKFLHLSSPSSNKTTKNSLKDHKQLKYGIVTKDGVVIDGNRRSMLLREIGKDNHESPVYFLAVVLEEFLDDNPKEIMRLETTYQMGEDAKVDYNAIEKYLKCKDLQNYLFSEDEIAKMMGEPSGKIKKFLGVMELMDDYLNKLGYNGIYTRLDKTEGTFWDLYDYLTRYDQKNKNYATVQWKYAPKDVNALKLVYFDYIRCMYNRKKSSDSGDAKEYRFIGQTSKKGSFFSNKEVWEKFRDKHFDYIDTIDEPSIEELRKTNPSMPIDELLKSRDAAWASNVDSQLTKNLSHGRESLDNVNKRNEPLELLESAYAKLLSVNIDSKAFVHDDKLLKLLEAINAKANDFKNILMTSNTGN